MTIIHATSQRFWLLIALAGMPLLAGCVTTITPYVTDWSRPPSSPMPPATVFVANGAGNYQMSTKALGHVVRKDGDPLEVITHDWSHGKHRFLADQMDEAHARAEGKKLADRVLAYRAENPNRPIYLLGHSAGTTVIMAALENLTPGVVERAILLSPSLSAEYDVRPALRSVKESVHVFYSHYDYFYLGVATRMLGTPDRRWTATAGRTGFRVGPVANRSRLDFFPARQLEPELLAKLVQRPWQPADHALGNNGGHFGNYQPDFLRAHIIPLFNITPRAIVSVP